MAMASWRWQWLAGDGNGWLAIGDICDLVIGDVCVW
jgi:hypothetical protein